MDKKVEYDGFEFDLESFPWNEPVKGSEIKQRAAEQIGREPEGAPYVARNGQLRHVAADESVTLQDGDRIGFTPTFETACKDITT